MRLFLIFLISISATAAQAGFLDDLLKKIISPITPVQEKDKQKTVKSAVNKRNNASWYNDTGKRTASGIKTHYGVAHKTLPFGTKLLVTNPANGKSVTATVVDRGPYSPGRNIDVNQNVAEFLDFKGIGQLLFEAQ